MDEPTPSFLSNKILAALSDGEYQALLPYLEPVHLRLSEVIYEMGGPVTYVYFPFQGLISLVTEMEDGSIVEVGLVGNDGMSGIAALMGEETSPERAIVQLADGGVRAKLSVIKEMFKRGGELQLHLLAYMRLLMKQVAQTAACNAVHTTEERFSRWLLMCDDRVDSGELRLTQEFIAQMLGTRRATVGAAAVVLQAEGYINYKRGHIRIIDRPGLESFTCECYAALAKSNSA
jgi:CRP-like cAMP-binding protein